MQTYLDLCRLDIVLSVNRMLGLWAVSMVSGEGVGGGLCFCFCMDIRCVS